MVSMYTHDLVRRGPSICWFVVPSMYRQSWVSVQTRKAIWIEELTTRSRGIRVMILDDTVMVFAIFPTLVTIPVLISGIVSE